MSSASPASPACHATLVLGANSLAAGVTVDVCRDDELFCLEEGFRKEMSRAFNRLADLVSGRHPAFDPMFRNPPDASQSSDPLA